MHAHKRDLLSTFQGGAASSTVLAGTRATHRATSPTGCNATPLRRNPVRQPTLKWDLQRSHVLALHQRLCYHQLLCTTQALSSGRGGHQGQRHRPLPTGRAPPHRAWPPSPLQWHGQRPWHGRHSAAPCVRHRPGLGPAAPLPAPIGAAHAAERRSAPVLPCVQQRTAGQWLPGTGTASRTTGSPW